jgi:hydrogenase maturation protein HypF
VEGDPQVLRSFLVRLEREKPQLSFIASLEPSWLEPSGYVGFEIRDSRPLGAPTALILPDVATCPECLREILDPSDRRFGYPFTNCTQCGPRFTIIESLPYDRANTSMRAFRMCPMCAAEYNDPASRRFHAQPNACPKCGPRLRFLDHSGRALPGGMGVGAGTLPQEGVNAPNMGALHAVAGAIRAGSVVAVKGLGGFHLVVSAVDDVAVNRLRERKHREEKPLALMFPSLNAVEQICEVSELEARLLTSSEAPIVLLKRREHTTEKGPALAPSIAPGNPRLGVMLPYTPLHHLLMRLLDFPIVATSGNLSDEPICIDDAEALERLNGITDCFLVHDRPIVRHADDSIVQVLLDREMVLRRARGYAPLPLMAGANENRVAMTVLSVGAHLKNTVALATDSKVFLSQHIGDLETERSFGVFQKVISDLLRLHATQPSVVVADLHPDYLSTRFARDWIGGGLAGGLPSPAALPRLLQVQHHMAHVLACVGENELSPPVLGVAWDGTGYGTDGTIWGGEFIQVTDKGCERVAHLRQFRLPGGEIAITEPRRSALGVLTEAYGEKVSNRQGLPALGAFSSAELAILRRALERKLNSPLTSSVGRLFDAVASLVGLVQRSHFEGQAAMALEFALSELDEDSAYAFEIIQPIAAGPLVVDWHPVLEDILHDLEKHITPAIISRRFHCALANSIVAVAERLQCTRVALSGGCFQNRYLLEESVRRLRLAGFQPYWHQRVPPNDGGISYGQAVAALRGNV